MASLSSDSLYSWSESSKKICNNMYEIWPDDVGSSIAEYISSYSEKVNAMAELMSSCEDSLIECAEVCLDIIAKCAEDDNCDESDQKVLTLGSYSK